MGRATIDELAVEVVGALPDGIADALPRGRNGKRGIKPATSRIEKLTERHHTVAKLLATGVPPQDVAIMTGYSPDHIYQLQTNPAFRNLLAFYKDRKAEAWLVVEQKLGELSRAALVELQERLEEDPDGFTNGALMELAKMALDRTGHGPQSTKNVNLHAQLVEKMEEMVDAQITEVRDVD